MDLKGLEGVGGSNTEDAGPDTEAKGTARAVPRETYQKFQKQSEAALDLEEIPLGHRQMIRRYFELIRPPGPADPRGPEPAAKGR